MGFEPVQTPDSQVSVCVQALPSVQLVPSVALGFEQVPVAGLQVPATWHWSLADRTSGVEAERVDVGQGPICVQTMPSWELVPLAAFGFEQVPVAGLHVPAT